MIDDIIAENITERSFYTEKLKKYLWSPIIKVLVGQRRVGKSYLLKSIIQYVVTSGKIPKENVLYINKEFPIYDSIKTYDDLKQYFEEFKQMTVSGKIFIGIDEVQEIDGWERFINGSLAQYGESIEIFITGSNSFLLSGELATYISWRYVEFFVSPLSFEEFCFFKKSEAKRQNFMEYLKYGWLPGIFRMEQEDETIFNYTKSIYNTIVLKDIVSRFTVKNVSFFEDLYKYVLSNIGNIFSAKNISDYLKSQRINISVDSVLNYLSYGEQTFIINKVKSVDTKTKRYFEIYNKYYVSDLGIRNSLVGFNLANDIGGMLENYAYILLKKYGFDIRIGRLKNGREIDFVAEKNGKTIYIQVATSILDPNTLEREYAPFEDINDHWPKYVTTFDDMEFGERKGIKHVNIMRLEETLKSL